MTALEYVKAIMAIKLILSEGMSTLLMLQTSIANSKELSDADKTTLLAETNSAQKMALAQKYPESET